MKLLIDEPPLQVLPSLAEAIGINEAIVLQQVHYWIQKNGKEHDERLWTYNSYANWQKQFPFYSERTIQRIFKNLEEKNLVLVGNYNKLVMDKTKWYSINYDELDKLACPLRQVGMTITTSCRDEVDKLSSPIPETNSESNTNINEFFETLWNLYPKKKGKGSVKDTQKKKLFKIGLDEMTRAIKRYISESKGTPDQFIQYGSSFFNSGYVDYLDVNYKKEDPGQKPVVEVVESDYLV